MPNIESLPKWAQSRIADLERDLGTANKTIDRLSNKTPKDEAEILVDLPTDGELALPHASLRFVLERPTHNRRAVCIDAVVITDQKGFRGLRLLGDQSIAVLPIASNGVELRFL